jgi:hypothetical protein
VRKEEREQGETEGMERLKKKGVKKGERGRGVMGPDKGQQSLLPSLPAIIQGSNEWLPRLAQGETFLPVHVEMELYLCVASLMMRSMHPGFLARILGALNWMH